MKGNFPSIRNHYRNRRHIDGWWCELKAKECHTTHIDLMLPSLLTPLKATAIKFINVAWAKRRDRNIRKPLNCSPCPLISLQMENNGFKKLVKFFLFIFTPVCGKKPSLSWVEGKIYGDKQSHLCGRKASWSVIKNERVFCKSKQMNL